MSETAVTAPASPVRPEAEFFRSPAGIAQRRYEALRAHLLEGLSLVEAAQCFGYSPATLASLARDFRGGHLVFFPPIAPRRRRSPAKERARSRIVELRRAGHSAYEISAALTTEVFAGLSALPEKTALTDYSYRLERSYQQRHPQPGLYQR